jgi:hypothetical protein
MVFTGSPLHEEPIHRNEPNGQMGFPDIEPVPVWRCLVEIGSLFPVLIRYRLAFNATPCGAGFFPVSPSQPPQSAASPILELRRRPECDEAPVSSIVAADAHVGASRMTRLDGMSLGT